MQNKFEIVSGKVCLSDPCYKAGTWCGKYDLPAKNGTWYVTVVNDGGTVHSFVAEHEDYEGDTTSNDWITRLGVDSGQFGVFDSSIYDGGGDFDLPGFYKDCCDTTLQVGTPFGVVQSKGFVSSSGYGDGVYNAFVLRNQDDELVHIAVTFIEDDEDEEDNFYCEDEEEDEEE